MPETDLVYADPPYSFVHYSRFYHALETLVRYDYPASEYYGRYRSDRHQSPFCVKTKVKKAFQDIILPVAEAQKKLVISYSNTGMITLGDLRKECEIGFGKSHVQLISSDYMHATMEGAKTSIERSRNCSSFAEFKIWFSDKRQQLAQILLCPIGAVKGVVFIVLPYEADAHI